MTMRVMLSGVNRRLRERYSFRFLPNIGALPKPDYIIGRRRKMARIGGSCS